MSIYLRANEILHEKGWSERGSYGPNGEVCILQALFEVQLSKREYNHALDVCEDLLRGDGIDEMVFNWNDRPEVSEEDVHLLLKRAHAIDI